MKKYLLILAVLFSLTATSCIRKASEVYGEPITKTVDIDNFRDITVKGGNVVVHFTQDSATTAKVTGPEHRLGKVTLTVADGILTVDDHNTSNRDNSRWLPLSSTSKKEAVHIYLTSPTLRRVDIMGAGDFDCKQPLAADTLTFTVAGAGDIDLDSIQARKMAVSIAGAGDVNIKEVVDADLTVTLSGAGDIDFAATRSNKIDISLGGAGDLDGKLNDCGDVSITMGGAGDADLEGTARSLTKHVGGVADLDTHKLKIKENR